MANSLSIDSAVCICYRNIIIKKNKLNFLHFQTSAREHNTFVLKCVFTIRFKTANEC